MAHETNHIWRIVPVISVLLIWACGQTTISIPGDSNHSQTFKEMPETLEEYLRVTGFQPWQVGFGEPPPNISIPSFSPPPSAAGCICGDIDNSVTVDLDDAIFLVDYFFQAGPAPAFLECADVNGFDELNVADLTYLIQFLFHEGSAPTCGSEGPDPTPTPTPIPTPTPTPTPPPPPPQECDALSPPIPSCADVPPSMLNDPPSPTGPRTCREVSGDPDAWCETSLNQHNSYYLLTGDLSCPRSGLTIFAKNSVFDLNGHTLTYGDVGYTGIPNFDFEDGEGGDENSPKAAHWSGDWNVGQNQNSVERIKGTLNLSKDHVVWFKNISSPRTLYSAPVNISRDNVMYRGHAIFGQFGWDGGPYGPCGSHSLQVEKVNQGVVESVACTSSGSTPSRISNCTFTPTSSQLGDYRLKITVNNGDCFVDAANLRPTHYKGIAYTYDGGKEPSVIKNGRITEQGDGVYRGLGIHNPTNAPANPPPMRNDYIIEHICSESKGVHSRNVEIWGPYNSTIRHSTFINTAPYLEERDLLEDELPIVIAYNRGHKIYNNKFEGGHGGIHFGAVRGENSTDKPGAIVSQNEFHVQTALTNHYAGSSWVSSFLIFEDNDFGTQARPMRNGGILLSGREAAGTENSIVRNNRFHLEGWRCDAEYPTDYKTLGIRLTDYLTGVTFGNLIEGNTFYGTATYDSQYEACTVSVNGIGLSASGVSNRIIDNEFRFTATNPETGKVRAIPVSIVGEVGMPEMYFGANLFASNQTSLGLGGFYLGDPYPSANCKFVDNTFERLTENYPYSEYHTVDMGANWDSNPEVDHIFLSNDYTGGASLEDIHLNAGENSFYVKWFLDITVKDASTGQPIDDANIVASSGEESISGASDPQGLARLALTEYYAHKYGIEPLNFTPYTPHTVQVSKSGYQTYTGTITMDATQSLTVNLVP